MSFRWRSGTPGILDKRLLLDFMSNVALLVCADTANHTGFNTRGVEFKQVTLSTLVDSHGLAAYEVVAGNMALP